LKLDKEKILAISPNASAVANAKKICSSGAFVKLAHSSDDTFYMGECKGSGKSNYVVDEKVPLSIPFEQYHFTVVSNKIVSVALKINGIVFSTSLRSDSPIEIVLPEHLYHFEFENQDTKRVISILSRNRVKFSRCIIIS